MNTLDNIRERFQQLEPADAADALSALEQSAITFFNKAGIPGPRNEEWKYTRISPLFNKEYRLTTGDTSVSSEELDAVRLPGFENANEIVFVNGIYSEALSVIRSSSLVVTSLDEAAANQYGEIVSRHLNHSGKYIRDGIHALNTAFVKEGIFIYVAKGKFIEHPVYVYHINDSRNSDVFSQARALVYVGEHAQVQFVENYATLGGGGSLTSEVMEVVVEKDAIVEYYKIQNDTPNANQVNTTHFRQTGKSVVHAVTISLNGGIVRNNLNIAMEAEHSESNLFGLYYIKGETHVDNHTVVDNVKPHCLSNELYKGVADDSSSAVFNGKIFVQPQAQKINAFQSNKNILLSDNASVNTKPQLEIFADDVKCSHGCTIGQLDEEGLFYLQSRGISKKIARSLLVHAFAIDILDHIKPEAIRNYVDQLISERLEYDIA